MVSEETHWIHRQIFKEILSQVKENDRETIKEYCRDLYTTENTFDLIEEYDSLREMIHDPNTSFALAKLMLEIKDYKRAEHFLLGSLSSENDNPKHQINILNKLSEVYLNTNQPDKAKQYHQQAKAIKQ